MRDLKIEYHRKFATAVPSLPPLHPYWCSTTRGRRTPHLIPLIIDNGGPNWPSTDYKRFYTKDVLSEMIRNVMIPAATRGVLASLSID
ncbi:hypothetical protein EJB05_52243 [Eragrostis curvula]|uniref:Uncharacterized protein n=1 Tax=Eragrostis curvula TaxID=38414 RepID=A0A5J9STC2_9POAL|nr:hypothetical protein EJB05_52243 [Eragrostis curvula]